MYRITLTHDESSFTLFYEETKNHLLLESIHLDKLQILYTFTCVNRPREYEGKFWVLRDLKLRETIQREDVQIKIEKRTNNPDPNEAGTYTSLITQAQKDMILPLFGLGRPPQYQHIPPVGTEPDLHVEPASKPRTSVFRPEQPRNRSARKPNRFVAEFSRFKQRTWDRLPTWGTWVIGVLLMLGTFVGLGAMTFGTAGLIAPAFAASLVVGLHLAGVGVSIPLAAFIGALVGGSVAAVLFGVIPTIAAISDNIIESYSAASLIEDSHPTSWSGCLSGFIATLTCDKFGNDETEYEQLVTEEQQSTCCTYGAKEAASSKAVDDSCFAMFKACLPESCGGTPRLHAE